MVVLVAGVLSYYLLVRICVGCLGGVGVFACVGALYDSVGFGIDLRCFWFCRFLIWVMYLGSWGLCCSIDMWFAC